MRNLTAWEHMTKRGGFLDTQLGKGGSAPFTNYTWLAFQAWVALCEAWYSADLSGRPHIEAAMREILATLQASELRAAKLVIHGVGNADAMNRLWPTIAFDWTGA